MKSILLLCLMLCVETYAQQDYDDQLAFEDLDDIDNSDQPLQSDNEIKEKYVVFNNGDTESSLTNVAIVFNNKNVRLITANCSALILNGTELYSIDVVRSPSASMSMDQQQQSGAGANEAVVFRQLGQLIDLDEVIVDVHYKMGNDYMLVLVALQSHYQVYAIYNDRYNGDMRTIEKIAMNGDHQRMIMFAQKDSWYCLIGNGLKNELKTTSSMRIFKWRQSHFTLLDQYSVTLMNDVRTCETTDGKILIMVVGSDSADEVNASSLEPLTLIEVYVFADDRLTHVQNLHTNWATLYTFYMDTRCVLVSMPEQRGSGLLKSETYVWDYNFHVLPDQQSILFDDMVTNNYDLLVIQNRDNLTAFTMQNFRRGQSAERKIEKNSKIVMLKGVTDQLFVAVIQESENDTSLTYHMHLLPIHTKYLTAKNANLGAINPIQTSEDCFKDLNKSILNRQGIIDELAITLKDRLRKDQNNNISVLIVDVASAHSVAFARTQINVTNQISVSKLRQQIDAMKARIYKLHELHSGRLKRNATQSGHFESLVVNRLWIANSSFVNVLLKNAQIRLTTPLTTKILLADQLHVSKHETDSNRTKRDTTPQQATSVQHLTVKQINGIEWDDFVSSLYLRNRQTTIIGNLIVSKPCLVEQAYVTSINNVPVSSFFTLHTSQTVESQVLFTHVHVMHLYTNFTNGIHFDTDIVLTTADSTIEGPVILQQCTIDQLTLAETESDSAFARHIVGTRLEDLSQIYSGKVTINGTLRLANVVLERPRKSPIFVNGQQFGLLDVTNRFWMKNIDQHIAGDVRFLQTVRTSQMFVNTAINSAPIAEHLLTTPQTNGIGDVGTVNLVFHTASIQGNLFTDRAYKTTVTMLDEQCVRRQDKAVRVAGHVTFTGTVTVDHFYSNTENTTAELALVDRNELQGGRLRLNSVRQFKQLTVLGGPVRITSDQLEVVALNGHDLMTGLQSMARIHEPTTLDELIVIGTVHATNLSLSLLGDIEFDRMSKRIADGVQLNTLHIGGSTDDQTPSTFSDLYVSRINGIDVDEYFSKVVTIRGAQKRQVRGQKRYQTGLMVHDLTVSRLNDLDLTEWFDNVLHTRRPQRLTGGWNIVTMTADVISALIINDVPLAELVDSANDVVEIPTDVSVAGPVSVYGDAFAADTECDLDRVRATLRTGLIVSNWRQIDVNGLATWTSPQAVTPIGRLYTHGVTSDTEQTIFGDTRFQQRTTRFGNLSISTPLINTVDVQQIFSDVLLSYGNYQQIRGEKLFVNGISSRSVTAARNLRAPLLNDCELLQLNATMFRTDDHELSGTKFFQRAPIAHQLHVVGGNVNDVSIVDIARAGDDAAGAPLPPVALLRGMHVFGKMDITNTLNYMPVDVMLTGRVRLISDAPQDVRGVLTFENLVIRGGRLAGTVNSITITDVVLQSADVEQALHGRKSIHGTVWLSGPAVVPQLNGVDVVQAFERSIRLDAAAVRLPRLEVMNNVSLQAAVDNGAQAVDDFTVLSQLNDVDVVALMYWQQPNADDLQPIHREILTSIARAEHKLQTDLMPGDGSVVYLDYASDIRIKFVKGLSATERDDAVFIDTHLACGRNGDVADVDHKGGDNDVNTQCLCPVQNMVVTSNKYQVLVGRSSLFERHIRLTGRNGNVTIITRFAPVACLAEYGSAAKDRIAFATVTWTSEKKEHMSVDLVRDPTSKSTVVQDVQLFEQDVTTMILFHFADGSVQAWKRSDDGVEWLDQGYIQYTLSINHMCVLRWQNYNLLLALTSPPTSANSSHSVHGEAQLFYFDGAAFQPLVSGAIVGDYDRCASVYMEQSNDLMLWLGKQGSDVVTVFKTIYRMKYLRKFELLQTIVVAEGFLHSILALQLIDVNYMAVLTQNGFLVLYRFNHLAGWVRTTSGYFKNIEYVLPLQFNHNDYLYISMKSSAIALKVHIRE